MPRSCWRRWARIVAGLPNRVSIAGHTSGNDSAATGGSWELSANRANQARALLQTGGLGSDRIYEVAGKAGSEPLLPEDPNASRQPPPFHPASNT